MEINSDQSLVHKDLPADRVVIFPPAACLIENLIDYLLSKPREVLERMLIVLPTRRLHTIVIAGLTEKLGTLALPRFHTLTDFTAMLAESMPIAGTILSERQLRLRLARIIDHHAFKTLTASHARELMLIWQAFKQNGLGFDALAGLAAELLQDYYRDPEHLAPFIERLGEIEACLGHLEDDSRMGDWTTATVQSVAEARWLVDHPEALAQASFAYDEMMIVGFTSMLTAEASLTRLLTAQGTCRVWLSASPQFAPSANPLKQLADLLGAAAYAAANRNQQNKLVMVSQCDRRRLEVQHAFTIVGDYLRKGIPLHHMAIIVTEEAAYADYLQDACNQSAFATNMALTRPLSSEPYIAWLIALCSIATVADLLEWMHHPFTATLLKVEEQATAVTYNKCIRLLAGTFRDYDIRRGALAAWPWPVELKTLIAAIDEWLTPCIQSTKKPAAETFDFAEQAYARLTSLVPNMVPLSDVAAEQLASAFSDLRTHYAGRYERPSTYLRTLATELRGATLRSIGEPLAALQIISLAESRYVPFSVAIIIGCHEGAFPKAIPGDELLSDFFKRRLGLPGWSALEAREDISFGLLFDRVPQLVMSYCAKSSGEDLVVSRYIQLLEAKGCTIPLAPIAVDSGPTYALGQGSSQQGSAAPANIAQVKLMTEAFSATTLEYFINCPYRFYLHRLGIKAYPLPLQNADKREEGEWLHRVFEEFMNVAPELGDEAAAVQRMLVLSKKHGPFGVEDSALWLHLSQFAYPRFIKHLRTLYPNQDSWISLPTATQRECKVDMMAHLPAIAAGNVRLQGKVDRVDHIAATRVRLLTDYKRQGFPDRQHQLNGSSPQLAFYAFALAQVDNPEQQSIEDFATGYWSMLRGEWQTVAAGDGARAHLANVGMATSRTTKLATICNNMLDLWQWRSEQLKTLNAFVIDPSQCRMCDYSPLCHKYDARLQDSLRSRVHLGDLLVQRAKSGKVDATNALGEEAPLS